ncbi:TNF receptor-associated factor 4-like [Hydractinia symbiolongicarpus]|uniref:TNF receptor-associated factor 4-like n=1 Tax=Hydractinia symbiolongicarpus TaxID=13093 RepID=UPI00254C769D|nr:TNF receptor-associated factor 4-like [Hydractinia symbiolongicarpus]
MEKEEHEGGYDYFFASSVPVDLTCVVCHSAMRDPVQIVNCGHRFCNLCYEKIKQHSLTRCVDLCCPLDREVIDPTKVFADKAAQRNIFDLIVKCSNHQQGCTWSDELRNIEAHMRNDCEYQMVECEHSDCKASMERRLLAQHILVCHDHKDVQNPWALQLLDKKIITIEKKTSRVNSSKRERYQ